MQITRLEEHVNFQNDRFGRSVVTSSDTAVLFLYSFKPGQAMTDHTHPFSAEIITILEGEAVISVGTESVIAPENMVFLVPPDTMHSIQNQSTQPLVVSSYMSPKP